MISFIVIGRNEGWKLTKCLQSVCDTAKYNSLSSYEIIYVDSKSTDDSIARAKEFENVRVFKLTGNYNAAIARNVGAKESSGDVLFFIDGDMEIQPEFLPLVYSEEKGLINNFVSGNWINYFYSADNRFLRKERYTPMQKDAIKKVTGGLFLIKKDIWNSVGGMRPIFKISQDIDLGLRLAKKGVFLLRKKEVAAIHHTISYMDKNRKWQDFFSWNHLYARSLLYRKHIFNKHMYARLLRNDYSALVLFFTLLCFIPLLQKWELIIIPYLLLLLSKTLLKSKKNGMQLEFLFLRDITTLFGLFFFFPKNNFKIKYIQC